MTDDWRDCGYSRVQTWASSRKTFSSDGRMGPSIVHNLHEILHRCESSLTIRYLVHFKILFTTHISYGEPSLRRHFLIPLSSSQRILFIRGCGVLGSNKTTSIIIISHCATFSVPLGRVVILVQRTQGERSRGEGRNPRHSGTITHASTRYSFWKFLGS